MSLGSGCDVVTQFKVEFAVWVHVLAVLGMSGSRSKQGLGHLSLGSSIRSFSSQCCQTFLRLGFFLFPVLFHLAYIAICAS